MPAPTPIESRDQLLSRVAFEAIWERSVGSDTLNWDPRLESIFGYPLDEAVNHLDWWRAHVHPDDVERVERTAREALKSGASGWSNEYRLRRRDGSWIWVASRAAIERDANGRPLRAVGAMVDISL